MYIRLNTYQLYIRFNIYQLYSSIEFLQYLVYPSFLFKPFPSEVVRNGHKLSPTVIPAFYATHSLAIANFANIFIEISKYLYRLMEMRFYGLSCL